MDDRKKDPAKSRKADAGKPNLSLLPPEALLAAGRAFSYGEKKYAAHNYRHDLVTSRIVASLLRHIVAWMGREEIDEENGLSHIDHIVACAMMLATNAANPALDDRYRPGEDSCRKS